jgi:hypothetical protein
MFPGTVHLQFIQRTPCLIQNMVLRYDLPFIYDDFQHVKTRIYNVAIRKDLANALDIFRVNYTDSQKKISHYITMNLVLLQRELNVMISVFPEQSMEHNIVSSIN